MNTSISERLKAIRGKTPQAEFAESAGINKSSWGRYERGETEPSSSDLEKICFKFDVSPAWLLLGIGPMRSGEPNLSSSLPKTPEYRAPEDDLILIPMVEARLSAGAGSLETSGDIEKTYAFRSDFLHRKGNPERMILMRVAGDSMEPEIRDNDVVLLDQSKRDIVPGKIFAVGFEESIYLKRIDNLPGKVILRSVNPAYPPVELDLRGDCEAQFRVIGRVLWCGREYK